MISKNFSKPNQFPMIFNKRNNVFYKGLSKRLPTIAPQNLDKDITSNLDRKLHALMGKFFIFSPASAATTTFDWFIHLAISPGKQIELAANAVHKWAALHQYMNCIMNGTAEQCVVPMSQDTRFNHQDWHQWPFNFYHQSFLLTEQWWVEATQNIRGVTQHHSDLLPFLVRQWLDVWSPSNFAATNPLIIKRTLAQGGMNLVQGFYNFVEDMERIVHQKSPIGSDKFVVGQNLATTPGKVIFQNNLIELIQYAPSTDAVFKEPILIVPAWIMKYYILDLSPHNSLVRFLIDKGHTVFMISWKNPSLDDRDLSFEDYLYLGVMESLEAIRTILPNARVHGVGYCLGGTLLTIAAAKLARLGDSILQSLTLLAAQVDFEEAGELQVFIDESQLSFLEDIMWEKGYLDSTRMANTFYMLRSHDLIWSRMVENYMLGERQEISDLMAWNADATRMPYKMHSEYLRSLYLNNDLSNNRFKIKGEIVSLSDIQVPLFAVSTLKDHIAPWQSVYKVHHFIDTHITFVLTSGGHNAGIIRTPGNPHHYYQIAPHKKTDILLSHEEWQEQTPQQKGSWWIPWQKWLKAHSSKKVPPPLMGTGPQTKYQILRNAPGQYVLIK